MGARKQNGGTFASDDLCQTVGQKGFDSISFMQTNKAMSGGDAITQQIPNLLLPDSSSTIYTPGYVSVEPSHIIPSDLTQHAIYPLYYATNYAPLLQVGAGKHTRHITTGVWKSPVSPRP